MKKATLNTINTKKLKLKKTAIANLQMSDNELRILIGGDLRTEKTSRSDEEQTNCTIITHQKNGTI
jgi:hypothetical protein